MADLFFTLPYVVDLDKPAAMTVMRDLFVTKSKKAHKIIITLKRGGVPVDFDGTVAATMIYMSDMVSQDATGKAEAGKVTLTFPDSFYDRSGLFRLVIFASDEGAMVPVFGAEGNMIVGETDSRYDPNNVVPSLAEVLAQLDAAKNATTAANNAAGSANTAAESANTAAAAANSAAGSAADATTAASNAAQAATTAADNANTATTNANNAAGAANQAAGRAENVASKSPYIGDNGNWYVYDVDAGEYVDSGRPSRGATGAVDGLDYFDGSPSALGTASPGESNEVARGDHKHPMPTAADVGALATADILDSLYPVGIIVPFANTVEPAAVWGGTWELLEEGRTVIQSGSTYALGSTGGEATVRLVRSQMPEHNHDLQYSTDNGATYTDMSLGKVGTTTQDKYGGLSNSVTSFSQYRVRVGYTGEGEPHNNMPPYLAVNIWQRTA